jgi:hypothetical protein
MPWTIFQAQDGFNNKNKQTFSIPLKISLFRSNQRQRLGEQIGRCQRDDLLSPNIVSKFQLAQPWLL